MQAWHEVVAAARLLLRIPTMLHPIFSNVTTPSRATAPMHIFAKPDAGCVKSLSRPPSRSTGFSIVF
jgi:hypothetical protein